MAAVLAFRLTAGMALSALALCATAASSTLGLASDDQTRLEPFPYTSLSGWSEREFAGSTDYTLVTEDGVRTLRGHARSTASVLYRERTIDLTETPILEWSWKVDRVFPMINERTKDGDDFPARLYVVARTGLLPWDTLAVNYVWSSNQAVGESWPNPYTSKAFMIPVRSGAEDVGRWTHERRDVAADFRRAFGKDIDKIAGFAIMVDGDNGKREAISWFADIAFLPAE